MSQHLRNHRTGRCSRNTRPKRGVVGKCVVKPDRWSPLSRNPVFVPRVRLRHSKTSETLRDYTGSISVSQSVCYFSKVINQSPPEDDLNLEILDLSRQCAAHRRLRRDCSETRGYDASKVGTPNLPQVVFRCTGGDVLVPFLDRCRRCHHDGQAPRSRLCDHIGDRRNLVDGHIYRPAPSVAFRGPMTLYGYGSRR